MITAGMYATEALEKLSYHTYIYTFDTLFNISISFIRKMDI